MKALTTVIPFLMLMILVLLVACDNSTSPPEIVVVLIDQNQEAGSYSVCWPQTDGEETQVQEGNYGYHILAGDLDEYRNFKIRDDFEHIGSECDPPITLPTDQDGFKTGDIIAIRYTISEAVHVHIDIVQYK